MPRKKKIKVLSNKELIAAKLKAIREIQQQEQIKR